MNSTDFWWSYPLEHFCGLKKAQKKRSLFCRFFSIHFTFCVHSAVFLDRTPAQWLYNSALRLKWPSRSPVLQDGRHGGRGSGQARRSGLWRLPGARLQARCQRALWRGRPGDHIQKPQVSYTATLVGHTGHWLWIAHNSALRTHSSILLSRPFLFSPTFPWIPQTTSYLIKAGQGYFIYLHILTQKWKLLTAVHSESLCNQTNRVVHNAGSWHPYTLASFLSCVVGITP